MTVSGVFDRAIYQQLCDDLSEADARYVLAVFIEDTTRRVAEMRVCKDGASISIEAHAIKSSAALFGFHDLSAHANALEQTAASLSAPTLTAWLSALDDAFCAAIAASAGVLGESGC